MSSHDPEKKIDPKRQWQRAKQSVLSLVNKKIKRAIKRLAERQEKLTQCQSWQQVYHRGELLQANLFRISKGMKELTIDDWEPPHLPVTFTLNPRQPAHALVAQYFKQSKKLHLGCPHAERLLTLAEAELHSWEQHLTAVTAIESMEDLTAYCTLHNLSSEKAPAVQHKKAPLKPYKCYHSLSNKEIWVGKNAKANNQMTFHSANGNDWWLHARDCPGSHVVIKGPEEPDHATIEDAAELALRFSKHKDYHGDVTITQVKYLKPVKGSPGQVLVSKHRAMRITLNEERWRRLNHPNL